MEWTRITSSYLITWMLYTYPVVLVIFLIVAVHTATIRHSPSINLLTVAQAARLNQLPVRAFSLLGYRGSLVVSQQAFQKRKYLTHQWFFYTLDSGSIGSTSSRGGGLRRHSRREGGGKRVMRWQRKRYEPAERSVMLGKYGKIYENTRDGQILILEGSY